MKKAKRFRSLLITLSLGGLLAFQNCGQSGQIVTKNDSSTGNPTNQTLSHLSVQILPSEKFICEPFGNSGGGSSLGNGLKAELRYLNPNAAYTTGQKNSILATDYFNNGTDFVTVSSPIYLSQINVPTRLFSLGFVLSDGSTVKDTQGNTLIEYFALRMKSLLKLAPGNAAGYYEIASLSDDGVKLYLDNNSGSELLISNDGTHATSMGCPTRLVQLDAQTKLPITYYYNQGPRTEIANVLIWRYRGTNPNVPVTTNEDMCGEASGRDYWDYQNNSQPGSRWQSLQAAGYSVLTNNNFELLQGQTNPCATQQTNMVASATFNNIADNGSAVLALDLIQNADIQAKLYHLNGSNRTLIQSFNQIQNQISANFQLPALLTNQDYVVDLVLTRVDSGVQVFNEIRFRLISSSQGQ